MLSYYYKTFFLFVDEPTNQIISYIIMLYTFYQIMNL